MNALEVSPFHAVALYKSTFTYLLLIYSQRQCAVGQTGYDRSDQLLSRVTL